MTYYAFHARAFLIQTKMADGDDVIHKACENFSLHLKYSLTLRPEQRQAVEALLQSKDVLAILQTGYGKSMIFQVYVAGAALKVKEHQTVLVDASSLPCHTHRTRELPRRLCSSG